MHAQFYSTRVVLETRGSGTILNEAHVRDRPPRQLLRGKGPCMIGIPWIILEMTTCLRLIVLQVMLDIQPYERFMEREHSEYWARVKKRYVRTVLVLKQVYYCREMH